MKIYISDKHKETFIRLSKESGLSVTSLIKFLIENIEVSVPTKIRAKIQIKINQK